MFVFILGISADSRIIVTHRNCIVKGAGEYEWFTSTSIGGKKIEHYRLKT